LPIYRAAFDFMLEIVLLYLFKEFGIELMTEASDHIGSDLGLLGPYPFSIDWITSAHAIG
jgi:hypothetical protein